jgi:hypothetical protein
MGSHACFPIWFFGKLGQESKNKAECQGVISRDIKGEKVKEDAFGFQSQ